MKRLTFIPATLLLVSVLNASAWAEVAVIVNPAVSASSEAKEIGRLYLGKISKLKDGTRLVPVDQSENATRGAFYAATTGQNASQTKAYWAKKMFTGKGKPPKSLDDDAAVKSWVSSHQNAVGYIDASAVDDSVRVMSRLP